VPLYADNKVRSGVELNGFNDAIHRGDGSDEQIVAGDSNGLMVARIHLGQRSLGWRNDAGKARPRSEAGRMGIDDFATGPMIHLGLDVLNERTVAPDIERLGTVAYTKDRLVEVEGVLKEELINGSTGGIGIAALRDWVFAESSWIHIETATRQQNALNSSKQPGNAIWALMQWNNDGGNARRVEGGKIGGQRFLVIFCVAAGWFRDGNVKRHGSTSVKTKHAFAIKYF
jgi:hypothetical protein